MYNSLFAALDQNTTVITVTRRLSDYLSAEYNQHQLQSGLQAWPAADIIAVGDCLKRFWYEAVAANHATETLPFLLSNGHEYAIWQGIISAAESGKALLQINASITLAQQAWQLLKQWRLSLDSAVFNGTEDTAIWQGWAKKFSSTLQKNNWLDLNSLPDRIVDLISQQAIKIPQKIFLVGFDEINPQYQFLFKQLAELGCVIDAYIPETISPAIKVTPLNDTTGEIESMAHWARQILQQQPEKTIACIVPELHEIRAELISIFTDVLAPTAHLPGFSSSLPFNLSGHFILAQYPLMRAALDGLALYKTIDFNKASALLRSPYLGYAEQEMCARARLDAALRQSAETTLSTRELLLAARKNNCIKLAELLNNYLATLPAPGTKKYPTEWSQLFSAQLAALGWPGERALNSAEYQLVERWHASLEEFAQYDPVLHKISLAEALLHLRQLLSNTLFQPQNAPSRLHILTPMEAAGLHFDYLWLMGLHDGAWPPLIYANPLLPIALQRQYKLPHAHSEGTLQFYRRLTQQLLQGANEIIISYPQLNAEQHLRPSALINHLLQFKEVILTESAPASLVELMRQQILIERYADHQAPALSAEENIKGGSSIFKDQALCPFRAFAHSRLGAQALPLPHTGLDARERGSILHRALEIIWRQLQDQKSLISKAPDELVTLIDSAIDTTLLEFIKLRPHIFKARFTQIEKARLQKMITAWLEVEKQRPPFKVFALEEQYETQLGGISLKMRIDRIDRTEAGDYLIFDYKTSLTSINNWFSDRPDDPQLPLYISTTPLPINGLAYVQLRSNQVQFKGISAGVAEIDGITPLDKVSLALFDQDWPILLVQWRRVLGQLAAEYSSGVAHCAPKKEQQTCRLCDLQVLCRIASHRQSE